MDYRNDANFSSERNDFRTHSKISWKSIIGGAFAGFGIAALLITLGIAIGISTINPWNDIHPDKLAVGQIIWWVICGIISMFFAGWFTGVLMPDTTKKYGVMNALVTWGFMVLLMIYMSATAAGAIIGGGISLIGSGEKMLGNSLGSIGSTIDKVTGTTNLNMENEQSDSSINTATQNFEETKATVDREVKEAADKAKKAAAGIAWAIFVLLLLEGFAAALGGALGVKSYKRLENKQSGIGSASDSGTGMGSSDGGSRS